MEKGLKDLAEKNCQYCLGEGTRFNGYFSYPCTCVNHVFESLGVSEIRNMEKEIDRLKEEMSVLKSQNASLLKRVDKLIDEKTVLESQVKTLTTGKGLAALLYIWQYNHNIHPDDFDSMFVPELLEKLKNNK